MRTGKRVLAHREPDAPLIVIGTGRCGSSLLHDLLAGHPGLAWLTRLSLWCPGAPWLGRLAMAALDLPVARDFLFDQLLRAEAYPFWERRCPGFTEPDHDLEASDVTEEMRQDIRRALAAVCTKRRSRLLLKLTGWPRTGYLREIFPRARFVHIYRDGRAVAASLVRMPWWQGRNGPNGWRWGPLDHEQRSRWEEAGRSPVVLAGFEWQILMTAFERARAELAPGTLHEVSYERFCADPRHELEGILEFADLDWPAEFERHFRRFEIQRADRWRSQISEGDARSLEATLRPMLSALGYS